MRGKDESQETKMQVFGITPAYAGKRNMFVYMHKTNQDHPRLCGEKSTQACGSMLRTGSPPPMRGKVPKSRIVLCKKGITPAYAGKSCGFDSICHSDWDHPRLCGEKHSVFQSRTQ